MAGKLGPRKLLVASVGVATINYVLAGCDSMTSTSANLVAAPGGGSLNQAGMAGSFNLGGTPPTSGNLPLPPGGTSNDLPVGGNVSVGGNAGTDAGGEGGVSEGGESSAAGQGGEGQGGAGTGGVDGAGGAP